MMVKDSGEVERKKEAHLQPHVAEYHIPELIHEAVVYSEILYGRPIRSFELGPQDVALKHLVRKDDKKSAKNWNTINGRQQVNYTPHPITDVLDRRCKPIQHNWYNRIEWTADRVYECNPAGLQRSAVGQMERELDFLRECRTFADAARDNVVLLLHVLLDFPGNSAKGRFNETLQGLGFQSITQNETPSLWTVYQPLFSNDRVFARDSMLLTVIGGGSQLDATSGTYCSTQMVDVIGAEKVYGAWMKAAQILTDAIFEFSYRNSLTRPWSQRSHNPSEWRSRISVPIIVAVDYMTFRVIAEPLLPCNPPPIALGCLIEHGRQDLDTSMNTDQQCIEDKVRFFLHHHVWESQINFLQDYLGLKLSPFPELLSDIEQINLETAFRTCGSGPLKQASTPCKRKLPLQFLLPYNFDKVAIRRCVHWLPELATGMSGGCFRPEFLLEPCRNREALNASWSRLRANPDPDDGQLSWFGLLQPMTDAFCSTHSQLGTVAFKENKYTRTQSGRSVFQAVCKEKINTRRTLQENVCVELRRSPKDVAHGSIETLCKAYDAAAKFMDEWLCAAVVKHMNTLVLNVRSSGDVSLVFHRLGLPLRYIPKVCVREELSLGAKEVLIAELLARTARHWLVREVRHYTFSAGWECETVSEARGAEYFQRMTHKLCRLLLDSKEEKHHFFHHVLLPQARKDWGYEPFQISMASTINGENEYKGCCEFLVSCNLVHPWLFFQALQHHLGVQLELSSLKSGSYVLSDFSQGTHRTSASGFPEHGVREPSPRFPHLMALKSRLRETLRYSTGKQVAEERPLALEFDSVEKVFRGFYPRVRVVAPQRSFSSIRSSFSTLHEHIGRAYRSLRLKEIACTEMRGVEAGHYTSWELECSLMGSRFISSVLSFCGPAVLGNLFPLRSVLHAHATPCHPSCVSTAALEATATHITPIELSKSLNCQKEAQEEKQKEGDEKPSCCAFLLSASTAVRVLVFADQALGGCSTISGPIGPPAREVGSGRSLLILGYLYLQHNWTSLALRIAEAVAKKLSVSDDCRAKAEELRLQCLLRRGDVDQGEELYVYMRRVLGWHWSTPSSMTKTCGLRLSLLHSQISLALYHLSEFPNAQASMALKYAGAALRNLSQAAGSSGSYWAFLAVYYILAKGGAAQGMTIMAERACQDALDVCRGAWNGSNYTRAQFYGILSQILERTKQYCRAGEVAEKGAEEFKKASGALSGPHLECLYRAAVSYGVHGVEDIQRVTLQSLRVVCLKEDCNVLPTLFPPRRSVWHCYVYGEEDSSLFVSDLEHLCAIWRCKAHRYSRKRALELFEKLFEHLVALALQRDHVEIAFFEVSRYMHRDTQKERALGTPITQLVQVPVMLRNHNTTPTSERKYVSERVHRSRLFYIIENILTLKILSLGFEGQRMLMNHLVRHVMERFRMPLRESRVNSEADRESDIFDRAVALQVTQRPHGTYSVVEPLKTGPSREFQLAYITNALFETCDPELLETLYEEILKACCGGQDVFMVEKEHRFMNVMLTLEMTPSEWFDKIIEKEIFSGSIGTNDHEAGYAKLLTLLQACLSLSAKTVFLYHYVIDNVPMPCRKMARNEHESDATVPSSASVPKSDSLLLRNTIQEELKLLKMHGLLFPS